MSTTYKNLLACANKHFKNQHDSEYVLSALAGKKRHELYLDNANVDANTLDKFHDLLNKHKLDMPVQYLTNKAFFLSYELYVDLRVLIPRPETEELVVKTIARLKQQDISPVSILEIGTGTGAIAIALADLFPKADINATDISQDALTVANINLAHYKMANRVHLHQADLFPITNIKFGLIISNPPYVPQNELTALSPTVKNYEPHIAIDGGRHGFEIIERIIKQAPGYLSQNGLLAIEIDPRQEKLIKDLVPSAQFQKDNQGFIRYAFIKKGV